MSEERHPLSTAALATLELPDATKAVLARGIPHEVAISDIMPTVFSSALGDRAVHAASPGPAAGCYVIGWIRDPSEPRAQLATFVLERGTGRVLLLDEALGATFVNSDLGSFLACLDELVRIAAEAQAVEDEGGEPGEQLSADLRSRIASADPAALRTDGYWGGWVDDLLVT